MVLGASVYLSWELVCICHGSSCVSVMGASVYLSWELVYICHGS